MPIFETVSQDHLPSQRVRKTNFRHPPIDRKVRPVDETALVACEEEDGVGLLDGFAEAAGGKVDFAAETLGGVVAEPVLEEGGAVIVFVRKARREGGERGT